MELIRNIKYENNYEQNNNTAHCDQGHIILILRHTNGTYLE
jgi:hypothetical protein